MRYLLISAGVAALALSAAQLGAQTITVSPNACQAPSSDVAYKPGVDAHGNAVAPADLSDSGQLNLTGDHEFWLPIEVPLEDVITIGAGDNLNSISASNIGVGAVTVKNGQAYFNGEPLGDAKSHAIAAECQKQQAASSQ
jgi:hypothetical protein